MRFGRLGTFVLAVVLAACGGAQARKAAYMAKGREYFAAHNFEKARLEFRNAVQLDPNDAEASYLAGQADERLGNVREAVQMYQDTIQSNSKHLGARAQLAKLYVFGGAADKALELVAPGLAIAPNNPDLLTSRAMARQALGDKASARADAEKAVQLAPTNESAIVELATIYSQAGESEPAIDLVKKAVAAPGASVNMHLVLAQLYLNAGQHLEAVQALQQAIALEPKTLINRFRLAQVLLLDKNVDAAEATLRAAVSEMPDSAEAKLALANLLSTYRSYEVAEAELRRMTAASPNDYQLRLGLGQFYASHKKPQEAEAVYRQIIKDDGTGPNGLRARNRLASDYLAANQLDAAAPLLDQVLTENPRDADALTTRAQLSLARGKSDAAITDLRAVQRDQPNSIAVQRQLARAYLENDDTTMAEETLRSAVQARPTDPDARLDLVQLLGRTGRVNEALPMLEKLAVEQPGNLDVLNALFRAQMARKDFAGARRTVGLVQTAQPELSTSSYLSGVVEQADGKPDAARAAFERAAAIAPDSVEPVEALTRLDLSKQRPEQAIARLDKVIAKFPKNPVARNLKGEVLAQLKRTDPAIGSFREAIALMPGWIVPYRNMASVEVAAGRNEDAIKSLQEGLKASDDAPSLAGDLAGFYERLGRTDEAIGEYEGFLKRHPESGIAANNLAMLLVTYRSDKASLDRARKLAERFASSRNPELIDTWGWVLLKRGETTDAIVALQKAVDKAPLAPVFRYHLAMAELKSGARDLARTNLDQALQSAAPFSGSDDAKKTLAELKR
jgi:tetratricopeptide (TPR) repeat protein